MCLNQLIGLTVGSISNTQKLALSSEDEPKKHFIGEQFGGGIIFFIDETGEHGLIAAPEDQSSSIEWGCMGYHVGASFLTDGKKKHCINCSKMQQQNSCQIMCFINRRWV